MSVTRDFEERKTRIGDYWGWEIAYRLDDVDELLTHARALEAKEQTHASEMKEVLEHLRLLRDLLGDGDPQWDTDTLLDKYRHYLGDGK